MTDNHPNWKFETQTIHAGQVIDEFSKSRLCLFTKHQVMSLMIRNMPKTYSLWLNQVIFTRIMNPTQNVFEARITQLEGGVGALATSSGQAAITLALLNIVETGSEIVASSNLYGGSYNLLNITFAKLGIKVHFVDPSDPNNFKSD